MINTALSQEKKRVRIRGWLLVYAIGPVGFGILAALVEFAELWRYGGDYLEWLIGIALLFAYLAGLYLLIVVRRRFTRFYHIGLTGFMAVALMLIAVLTSDPAAAVASAGMSIWLGYWSRSKRVRQTYCVQDNRQH
jgi:hypothetical protein